MEYRMEELVPIVAELAEKYTSGESTSITYEKAQQLMEAVLYCIHEGEEKAAFSLVQENTLSAEAAYEYGIECVEQKVKDTLAIYNQIMSDFDSYGNRCLYDTVVKGLPEFFKWYDPKYSPQNTILTMDYPVLIEDLAHTGIDRIYDYITCIQLEHKFLSALPSEYVMNVLIRYDRNYKEMIDNICEVILMDVILHILAGKDIRNLTFEEKEFENMQKLLQDKELQDIRKSLKEQIDRLVQHYYGNDERLKAYLEKAVDNIAVRIKFI